MQTGSSPGPFQAASPDSPQERRGEDERKVFWAELSGDLRHAVEGGIDSEGMGVARWWRLGLCGAVEILRWNQVYKEGPSAKSPSP